MKIEDMSPEMLHGKIHEYLKVCSTQLFGIDITNKSLVKKVSNKILKELDIERCTENNLLIKEIFISSLYTLFNIIQTNDYMFGDIRLLHNSEGVFIENRAIYYTDKYIDNRVSKIVVKLNKANKKNNKKDNLNPNFIFDCNIAILALRYNLTLLDNYNRMWKWHNEKPSVVYKGTEDLNDTVPPVDFFQSCPYKIKEYRVPLYNELGLSS